MQLQYYNLFYYRKEPDWEESTHQDLWWKSIIQSRQLAQTGLTNGQRNRMSINQVSKLPSTSERNSLICSNCVTLNVNQSHWSCTRLLVMTYRCILIQSSDLLLTFQKHLCFHEHCHFTSSKVGLSTIARKFTRRESIP